MERISQLISDYLDGELDDAAIERLAESLQDDQAVVDQLVLDSFVHAQLYQWMNVRQMRDELLADAFGEAGLTECSLDALEDVDFPVRSASELAGGWKGVRHASRRWLGVVAAIATMLLIAVAIIAAAYVIGSRPAIVAQLTQEDGCVWPAAALGLPVGALLREGQELTLVSGKALVTFECGAQMVVAGPASVRLISASKADLRQGRVGAKVPTHAIGFTVATPAADFVDLGTEFTLTLEESNSCELQVFDGLVELRLFEQDRRAIQERLKISEGSAVRFDAARRDVDSIPYVEEQRILP